MLTNYMNYNPRYDYYPGLASQGQGKNQSTPAVAGTEVPTDYNTARRIQIQQELAQLDKEWREAVNTGMNSSIGGFITNSLLTNQPDLE